jgi:predicted DNA binding CopG/RHH family protein
MHETRPNPRFEPVPDHVRRLITEYERGACRPVRNQDKAKEEAMEAVRRYRRKGARINIRLSTADLELLKRRAVEEGLPYQSLIAGILHQCLSRSTPLTT